MEPDRDVVAHYEDRYDEDVRLAKDGLGQLERPQGISVST